VPNGQLPRQRGCARCARHTLITSKQTDQQLLKQYDVARQRVAAYLADELEQAA